MPEYIKTFDTPAGKVKAICSKSKDHFICRLESLVYRDNIKLDRPALISDIEAFLTWLKNDNQ